MEHLEFYCEENKYSSRSHKPASVGAVPTFATIHPRSGVNWLARMLVAHEVRVQISAMGL